MKLVVNNNMPLERSIARLDFISMTIPVEMACEIISETLWDENPWLEKYTNTDMLVHVKRREIEVRFMP